MTTHKWQFATRFRRNAFGWKSDTPIQRIKEALTEIKAVAKKEPVLAAEGAVLFVEKLAPAIKQVDSSSGGIGCAVNRATKTPVSLIAMVYPRALSNRIEGYARMTEPLIHFTAVRAGLRAPNRGSLLIIA